MSDGTIPTYYNIGHESDRTIVDITPALVGFAKIQSIEVRNIISCLVSLRNISRIQDHTSINNQEIEVLSERVNLIIRPDVSNRIALSQANQVVKLILTSLHQLIVLDKSIKRLNQK